MASAKPTSDTPPVKSGVSSGIRIVIALLIAIILGIFMLTWDGQYMPHSPVPDWIGGVIFTPLIAVVLAYGGVCLIQQLSCGQVQWLIQLNRVAVVPVPFIIMWALLYMMPGIRWPIEGLMQSGSPAARKGLSSAFYTFWIGLYTQSMLNGVAQLCPN